jgi:hypothetical protein
LWFFHRNLLRQRLCGDRADNEAIYREEQLRVVVKRMMDAMKNT